MARRKSSHALFALKIAELQAAIERLQKKEAEGWTYQKFYIKPTTVKAHRRRGYEVLRPVKRRTK